MKVIVTGGAGFIGSSFIKYMLGAHPDYWIVCLDKLTYAGDVSRLDPVSRSPGFRFVRLDICDTAGVRALFEEERPDLVVNFAAESHVDRSIGDPSLFIRTNTVGTGVLMDACLEIGARFHQVSTDEVYGDLPLGSAESFDESSPLRPSGPYSASKAAADLLTLAYVRTYGLRATISRCSNNYGPGQHPEKLVPRVTADALVDRPIRLYGRGVNVRDWIFVGDHCRALDLIVHNGRTGEIYNVGGGCELSNLELVRTILDILGSPNAKIEFVKDRPGHDLRYSLDCSKLRRELEWEPRIGISEGLARTVEAFREELGR